MWVKTKTKENKGTSMSNWLIWILAFFQRKYQCFYFLVVVPKVITKLCEYFWLKASEGVLSFSTNRLWFLSTIFLCFLSRNGDGWDWFQLHRHMTPNYISPSNIESVFPYWFSGFDSLNDPAFSTFSKLLKVSESWIPHLPENDCAWGP